MGYGCDCEGPVPALRPYSHVTAMTLEEIAKVAGARPPSCPWRSMREPIVGRVLDLYRAVGGATEGGAVRSRAMAIDPPHCDWLGLQYYCEVVSMIRSHDAEVRAEQQRQQKARKNLPNQVVNRRG